MHPIISVAQLHANYADYVVIDCRFDLMNPDDGLSEYRKAHLPGAAYLHLDHALSDVTQKSTMGRHPLPTPAQFGQTLSTLGITRNSKIVCYEQSTGLYAARLWWLLKASGFTEVQVLDGGFAAWQQAGFAVNADPVALRYQPVEIADFAAMPQIGFDLVPQFAGSASHLLLDARAPARFAGSEEPIDPIAGHIPGAVNRPATLNFRDGRFKPADELRSEFAAILGSVEAANVAHSCGSGVTACLQMLAMEVAGLSGSKLFAPSWSGWITDPNRPIAH